MSSDAEEGEKEQEAATEEEEGPREMTLEEYKQKHSTVSCCYLDTWNVSPVCVCVWGGGEGDWICFRRGTAAMAPLHVGECSS